MHRHDHQADTDQHRVDVERQHQQQSVCEYIVIETQFESPSALLYCCSLTQGRRNGINDEEKQGFRNCKFLFLILQRKSTKELPIGI